MSMRKLLITGSTVLLAGSMNVDDFLLACTEQPVTFEVSKQTGFAQNSQYQSLMHLYLYAMLWLRLCLRCM